MFEHVNPDLLTEVIGLIPIIVELPGDPQDHGSKGPEDLPKVGSILAPEAVQVDHWRWDPTGTGR